MERNEKCVGNEIKMRFVELRVRVWKKKAQRK